ncbi:MAG: hypothetical protein R3E60_06970 [Alphaproteobacteria bacterium]
MKRPNDGRQLGLEFDREAYYPVPKAPPSVAGSLEYAPELCGILSLALKDCPDSRAVVAAKMSDLTGQQITEAMLNAWTSPAHDRHRFPFEFAGAFEEATGTTCLQELLARKRGCKVLAGRQVLEAELGNIERSIVELTNKRKRIRKQFSGGKS